MFIEGQHLGDFEILEQLGQGGMGAVYKARQVSLDRLVALKTLQGALASDPEYIARFRREAKAAAALNHPNLVQVYAAGENDGLHWFAMEYVEGESAQARLKRKTRLDPEEAIAIATHVATALDYAWRKAQLIHRDIKPDNIFLSTDGEVKLGDLGLAKSAGETQSLTMTGSSMGTPHYVSPEQAEGKKDVDLRADIYSLGCTLFHLVSGEAPFKGDTALAVMMKHVTAPVPNVRSVWPECPEELARVVLKMMLKQPAARPQSYGEVIADLRRAYDELTGATMPPGVAVTQQAAPQKQAKQQSPVVRQPATAKKQLPIAALAVTGLALLAGIVALFYFAPWKKGGQLPEAERLEKERTASGTIPVGSESKFSPVLDADGIRGWRQNGSAKWDFTGGVLSCQKSDKSTTRLRCPKDFAPTAFEIRFAVRGDRGPAFEFRGNAGDMADSYVLDPTALRTGGSVFWDGKQNAILARAGQRIRITRDDQREELSKLTAPPQWKDGDWNEVTLTVQGNHFSYACNGTPVAELTDESPSYRAGPGEFGFRMTNNTDGELSVEFKDIRIRRLSATPAARATAVVAATTGISYPQPAKWISLMDRIDPAADAVRGRWLRVADGLQGNIRSKDENAAVLQLPYEPPEEYDFRIAFTVQSGELEGVQILTARGRDFRWTTGAFHNGLNGFDLVNGNHIQQSPAAVKTTGPFKVDQKRVSMVEVRRDHVTGYIDGPKILEWKTDYSDMSIDPQFALRDAHRLGVGIWVSRTTFHEISVRDVTGAGKLLRGAAPAPVASGTPTATKDAPFVNTLGQEFVPVPGTQVLFCRWDTRVKDYAEFARVNKVDDSWTKQEKDGVPVSREPEYPVVGVSWDDAQAFNQWLTEKEIAEGKLPKGARYRLPTDEEWSLAVGLSEEQGATPAEKRGKNTVDFPWGKEYPPRGKVGNYEDETWHEKFPDEKYWIKGYMDGYATTSPVGIFAPNAYGLYDMGGNVWQWCEDWLDATHKYRVERGTSFRSGDRAGILSSNRGKDPPATRSYVIGFRCVLAPATSALATPTYPQPAKWTDATAQLRTQYLGSGDLVADGEWLHITRGVAMFNLTPGQQFRNPIVRVRYSGRVDIALRRQRKGNDDLRYEAGVGPATVELKVFRPAGSQGSLFLVPQTKLDPSYRPDEEHEAVFAAQGDTLSLWIDGRKIATAQHTALSSGELAFLMKNDASGNCRVKKVEYAELPDMP